MEQLRNLPKHQQPEALLSCGVLVYNPDIETFPAIDFVVFDHMSIGIQGTATLTLIQTTINEKKQLSQSLLEKNFGKYAKKWNLLCSSTYCRG